jgi:hypothetical protein
MITSPQFKEFDPPYHPFPVYPEKDLTRPDQDGNPFKPYAPT